MGTRIKENQAAEASQLFERRWRHTVTGSHGALPGHGCTGVGQLLVSLLMQGTSTVERNALSTLCSLVHGL